MGKRVKRFQLFSLGSALMIYLVVCFVLFFVIWPWNVKRERKIADEVMVQLCSCILSDDYEPLYAQGMASRESGLLKFLTSLNEEFGPVTSCSFEPAGAGFFGAGPSYTLITVRNGEEAILSMSVIQGKLSL